jgi:hypothetical protein
MWKWQSQESAGARQEGRGVVASGGRQGFIVFPQANLSGLNSQEPCRKMLRIDGVQQTKALDFSFYSD